MALAPGAPVMWIDCGGGSYVNLTYARHVCERGGFVEIELAGPPSLQFAQIQARVVSLPSDGSAADLVRRWLERQVKSGARAQEIVERVSKI